MRSIRKPHDKIMIRFLLTVLLLGMLLGTLSFGFHKANAFFAQAADGAEIALTTENASLFLPESYENYLGLTNPSYAAISEKHTVIADGNELFIYDRAENQFVCYKHTPLNAQADAKITNVQIAETAEKDRILFSDTEGHLFEYRANDTAENMLIHDIPCSTFLIDPSGEYLFTANASENTFTFHRYPLSDTISLQSGISSPNITTSIIPRMTVYNGKLYCAIDTSILCSYTVTSESGIEKLFEDSEHTLLNQDNSRTEGLQSICAYNQMLYYTVNNDREPTKNGIWRADFAGNASLIEKGDGFSALFTYADALYCVRGKSILQLAEDGTRPACPGYEIAAASDSVNRLSGAKDSVRASSLLVTADSGNQRLSVYDMQTDTYTVLPLSYSPALTATDGTMIAAAEGNRIYTYTRNKDGWQEEVFPLEPADTVKGLTCLYGKVYFASEHHHGAVGEEQILNQGGTPAGLASDLYGDLFLAFTDNTVRRYTEAEFMRQSSEGSVLEYTLPDGFASLRSDFEGNLYCLGGAGVLYRNGEQYAAIDGKNFVYATESLYPVSFALGFEDDTVYFNFGNFLVGTKAEALGFPSLGTISAEGVYDETSRVHAPDEVGFVDVAEGAVGIAVDLTALDAKTVYFPFASYSRAQADRGVLLAETENYNVVALYRDRLYDVRLFRKEECTPAEAEKSTEERSQYLSSGCALYNYPCITAAKGDPIPRGACVKVLGKVRADSDPDANPDLGYDFAYIEVETNARALRRGYVPWSFLTDVDPSGQTSDDFAIARLKPSAEEIEFLSADGRSVRLAAGTVVRIYQEEDGTLTARYTDESGTEYFATVTEKDIDRGESDALRISLIVILSVVALLIIGGYFFLLPRDRKIRS